MRSKFLKVKIYSLEDGGLINYIDKMHSKPILSLCILDDMKTLISAGKDKKIKVWNIVNQ